MPKRLAEDAVLFIRRYHRAGYRVTTIAGALGVSRKAVSAVVNGRTHKTVLDSDLPPLRPVKVDCEPILADGRTGAHIPETAPTEGEYRVVVPEQSTPPESIIEAGYRELDTP